MKNEHTLEELRQISQKYAEAEAERQYLMEFRKSKKAILMAQAESEAPSLPIGKQERYAYAHPEYIELLQGLKVSIEKALLLKHQMQVITMRFEQWRSHKATERAEMTAR